MTSWKCSTYESAAGWGLALTDSGIESGLPSSIVKLVMFTVTMGPSEKVTVKKFIRKETMYTNYKHNS